MSEAPIEAPEDAGGNRVAVTPRDRLGRKEGRKEGGGGSPEGDSTRARTRVRARGGTLSGLRAVTHGVQVRGVSWREKTPAEAAAPDIHESDEGAPRSFWRDGPAPAADVAAYTKSGAWLRGERNPALERGGKLYGFGVAVPLTLLLGALIWCAQRPSRLFTVAVIAVVLWFAVPAWDSPAVPAPPAGPSIGATP